MAASALVRLSCGLLLLVGATALVQMPPAKQVQVLGCFGGTAPNATRCEGGKCHYMCVRPNLDGMELVCEANATLHQVGVSAGGVSWACQDLIRCPAKPALIGCNCTEKSRCIWGCAYWGSLDMRCNSSRLEYPRPGTILDCREGTVPEELRGGKGNWAC
ncbi:unnamed protein product [Symbiodinium natans]|uniref:Uncharacterized protein n=1 Tax=Symbiodinium natans TaxID=878477 RepID=A0A812MQK5_9DINO|nr:unnamed protein product [Symbiodinium natans]